MDELIRIIFDFLESDEGPELFEDNGGELSRDRNLEVAQQIAEAIVSAGWPRN